MSRKGLLAFAGLLMSLGLLLPAVAQDAEDAAGEDTDKKPGLFGNRFALFLETMVGASESDDISTTVATTDIASSINSVSFDDQEHARFSVGWLLPEDKGSFVVVWNGFKETEYSFNATGTRAGLEGTGLPAPEQVPWWDLQVAGGQLVSQAQTPTWVRAIDDADGDGVPDMDEIRIEPSTLGASRSVVDTLQNQLQTLDFFFQRDWGGRMINATWGGGVRYLAYEGNVPVAAWLNGDSATPVPSYTDGANMRLLSFSQKTTGFGPSGFAEVHFNFTRDKVVLYLLTRASFVIQDLEADSGLFYTLAPITQTLLYPAAARVVETRGKDVWHTGAEIGARFQLAQGLRLQLAFFRSGYADTILVPNRLNLPQNSGQADQGTTALFATRDIRVEGWRGGFSFQF